jgi:hypothetical protein
MSEIKPECKKTYKEMVNDALLKNKCKCGALVDSSNVIRAKRGKPNIVEYGCPVCKEIFPVSINDMP